MHVPHGYLMIYYCVLCLLLCMVCYIVYLTMGSVYKCKEHEEGIIILVTSTSHYIDSPRFCHYNESEKCMQLKHLNKHVMIYLKSVSLKTH